MKRKASLSECSFLVMFNMTECGPGGVVGKATGYELDSPGIECGPCSVVGIATGYGLDGPGIKS